MLGANIRERLDACTPEMVQHLGSFVNIESPSNEVACLDRSAEFLRDLMTDLLGIAPRVIPGEKGPHVLWSGGGVPRVLIVGHHDTVFPLGTIANRPFTVDGDNARGPGVFDMKGGIIQAIYALSVLEDVSHVEMLITADEEIGSYSSRSLIEERARAAGSVLVLEPAADGDALKVGRKGVGTFVVDIEGRAAHAGLEPEKGINALMELAQLVPRIAEIAQPTVGTTVTPTVATAGSAENVVPASARIIVDTRVVLPEEKGRVESAMNSLSASLPGAKVTVSGSINRPPMHESAARELFALAQRVAPEVGIESIAGISVGGGSDGNFTAAIGIPTLDGLGACGAGAHAEHEYVKISKMGERSALVAALVAALA